MNQQGQKQDTGMAVLCYLSLLLIIPAICGRQNAYIRFHLNQGLILLIANLIFGAISFIPVLRLVGDLLNCAVFILAIIGVLHAWRGEETPLPLVGGIRLIK